MRKGLGRLTEDIQKNIRLGTLGAFLLSLVAVFALHCNFEVTGGMPESSALVEWLHRVYVSFSNPEFTDLFVFAAVFMLLRFVADKDRKVDMGCLVFSFVLSWLLVVSISFKKFSSLIFLQVDFYQLCLSGFCIIGFWIILYALIRCICYWFDKSVATDTGEGWLFLEKHLLSVGFGIIFLGWLPWILMNYPGSGCGDSVMQLQQFLGEIDWDAAHPTLSTMVMGGIFSLGRMVVDANFGFFLYCFMQTCVGAWVFSFSIKKLKDLGIPAKWCIVGLVWFALTPLWGTYAQWVEKDLFYTEIALFQTICILDILVRKECGKKEFVLLVCSSLGTVFLRNNGILAVLPVLVVLAARFRGSSVKRIITALLVVLLIYEGVMKGLHPALGVREASNVDVFNIPLQQTARYVCEYSDEVTEYEREVLDKAFGYGNLFHYNPVYSDPIKSVCKGGYLDEYLSVWAQMFWKHPGTYLSAFLNNNYGYLAPIEPNIEGWIQLEYYDYLKGLGIYHVFDREVANVLMMVWNLSMTLPLAKYLCTPGMYTWIVAILAMLLIRRKKYEALILFVPSFMNISACLGSAMAGAIRYELPVVASVPLLVGWTYYSLHKTA